MIYRYYITQERKEWWEKQRFGTIYKQKLDQFLNSQEKNVNTTTMRGAFFMNKINGVNSRPTFIWKRIIEGEIVLYVFRMAYIYDEYKRIIKIDTIDSWIEKNDLSDKESIEIKEEIDRLKNCLNKRTIKELEFLSEKERNFLNNPITINHSLFKDVVYETEEWRNSINPETFVLWTDYAERIREFIYNSREEKNCWHAIESPNDKKRILIYNKDQNWILSDIKEEKYTDDWVSYLNNLKEPVDYLQGYPIDYLFDSDLWEEIEKDSKNNLVLSKEQVKCITNENIEYPFFLTGRAGSGKSTLLQYLFAENIIRYVYVNNNSTGKLLCPIYISYSENLIKDAKERINGLISTNSSYIKKIEDLDLKVDHEIREFINTKSEDLFFVFQELVKKCISNHDKDILSNQFSPAKYVTYSLFNRMWNQRFGKTNEINKIDYGPSLCWHVIRTYIKGWGIKDMTPSDYENIPRNHKTVKQSTFATIYNEVWEKWYKIQDCWDDQDLVRHCLTNDYAEELCSSVICDEAQDFTRIELDFIFKISEFSNRKIDNYHLLKSIPFVFAGDEFQTLNPTGFSWNSLRAYFSNKLFEITDLEEEDTIRKICEPIELKENYRSTKKIVQLANRIQLLRASRFGEESIPQEPHFSQEGKSIFCLPVNDYAVINKLIKNGTVLIVPTAEGQTIQEYIQGSPLCDKIEFDKNGIPQGITILNPMQAKGLEYTNVAIYGFNNNYNNEYFNTQTLINWFNTHNKNERSEESDIDLKYQISNAYVAVTRSRKNLYILDNFSCNDFWGFAYNYESYKEKTYVEELTRLMINSLSPAQKKNWEGVIFGEILRGNSNDISKDSTTLSDKISQTKDLETRADYLNDPMLMRQASCRYRDLNDKNGETRCWAKAYIFEQEYEKAGYEFCSIQMYEDAINSYYYALTNAIKRKANPSSIVEELYKISNNYNNNNIIIKATILSNKNITINEHKCFLDELYQTFEKGTSPYLNTDVWNYYTQNIGNNINAISKSFIDFEITEALGDKLKRYGIEINYANLAQIAYQSQAIEIAITFWEKNKKGVYPKEYYLSKFNTSSYPEKLLFVKQAHPDQWKWEVYEEYKSMPNIKLKANQKDIIFKALSSIPEAQEIAYTKFLPYALSVTNEISDGNDLINTATKYNPNLNTEVILSVLSAKCNKLKEWKRPRVSYADSKALSIIKAISLAKNIYENDFVKNSLPKSPNPKEQLNGFIKTIKEFANKPSTPFLYSTIGIKIEERGIFIDAVQYYKAIKDCYNEDEFNNEMAIRLLYNQEQLALRNDPIAMDEAPRLRRFLGLTDKAIEAKPNVSQWDWEVIFQEACTVSNETLQTEPMRETKTESTKQPLKNITIPKQVTCYKGYEIAYIPSKKEVVIKLSEEELRYKIKNGVLPQDDDFVLKNSRLYKVEDNTLTPFKVSVSETQIMIEIYENMTFTGVRYLYSI